MEPAMKLHIATPCHEDWSGMTPHGPGRHCASCDKTVVDLTALAPAASTVAMKRIAQRIRGGEHLCVRAHVRADGVLRPTRVHRRLLTNGMAAMLAMAMASGLTGCGVDAQTVPTDPQVQQVDPPRAQMGEACVPEPTPEPVIDPVEPEPEPEPVVMGKIAAPEPAPAPVEPEPLVEPQPLMGDVCIPEEETPVPQPEPEPVMGIVCAPEVPDEVQPPPPEPDATPTPVDPPSR